MRLNRNKVYDLDMIIIRILKICGKPICKPLEIVYKDFLYTSLFLLKWKKGNIGPSHETG